MSTTKNVIFAEDTSMHRVVLKSNLRNAGNELGLNIVIVGEAENGAQLLELYSKQPPGSIDIVFSDIRMPVMDGLSSLVMVKHLNPNQKVVMASSEDIKTMDAANAQHGEQARKTIEQTQRMDLLNKVADRLRKGVTEEGKTNSILTGCEKLALDPIWVAEQYGASGYLRKPYDPAKTKEMLQFVLGANTGKFLAKV